MNNGHISKSEHNGAYAVKMIGELRFSDCELLNIISDLLTSDKNIKSLLLDLSETTLLDSTILGKLAQIAILFHRQHNKKISLFCPNSDIDRVLISMGLESILERQLKPDKHFKIFNELTNNNSTETDIADQILQSHKTLASISKKNAEEFRDVIESLKNDVN